MPEEVKKYSLERTGQQIKDDLDILDNNGIIDEFKLLRADMSGKVTWWNGYTAGAGINIDTVNNIPTTISINTSDIATKNALDAVDNRLTANVASLNNQIATKQDVLDESTDITVANISSSGNITSNGDLSIANVTASGLIAGSLDYATETPSATNDAGLKIVISDGQLPSHPNGYLYLQIEND